MYDLSQNENIIPIKHVRFNEANNKIRGALPPNNEPLVIETAKPANNEIKEITAKIDEIKIDLPENTFSPSSSSIRTGIKVFFFFIFFFILNENKLLFDFIF